MLFALTLCDLQSNTINVQNGDQNCHVNRIVAKLHRFIVCLESSLHYFIIYYFLNVAFISAENDLMQQNKQWHNDLNSKHQRKQLWRCVFFFNSIYLSVLHEVKNVVLCFRPFLHVLLNSALWGQSLHLVGYDNICPGSRWLDELQ